MTAGSAPRGGAETDLEWYCTDCGAVVEEAALSCPKCGRSLEDDRGVLADLGGGVVAFLIGLFGTALPFLFLTWRVYETGQADPLVIGPGFFMWMLVGILVAPALGAIAWLAQPGARGLVFLLGGVILGGAVAFAPTVVRGPDDQFYDDVWQFVMIVDAWGIVLFTIGWGLRAGFARWTKGEPGGPEADVERDVDDVLFGHGSARSAKARRARP